MKVRRSSIYQRYAEGIERWYAFAQQSLVLAGFPGFSSATFAYQVHGLPERGPASIMARMRHAATRARCLGFPPEQPLTFLPPQLPPQVLTRHLDDF